MERIGTLVVAPTTERKAEPGRFSETLRSVAADTMNGIAGSLTLAAPYLPGGAVLAGALRTAVPASPAPGPTTGIVGSPAPALASTVTGPLTPGVATAIGTGATGVAPTGGGDLVDATRALQQQAQSFNLQFLQLQESMQRESREYTALSNVMKARHDTAKSVIGNIH